MLPGGVRVTAHDRADWIFVCKFSLGESAQSKSLCGVCVGWEMAVTCVYGKSSLCPCVCTCMRTSITVCACPFVLLSLPGWWVTDTLQGHLGSHTCSHPRHQWPHEANLTGPITQLTNFAQSHTNTHSTGILPVLSHARHLRHSRVPAHRALRAFTPGYSQTQPGECFAGDPQRNTHFKQSLHNKPQREAWVLLCCG